MGQVQSSIVSTERGYRVSLPFRGHGRPDINFRNAYAQLNALESKFIKDPEYHQNYERVLQTYIDAGFIYEVKNPEIEGYYLPHFGVKKQSLTTPLRIVFNASSKTKGGLSLNDCLYPGPNLVELLYDLLIKFRTNPYALISDISKAFHRVLLHPDDAKYARFLWRRSPNRTVTYAFKVVVFGITSSPYLLQQVLQTHLKARGREDVLKSFYVDNYLQTYETEEEMRNDHSQVQSLLDEAHMPLLGWASNSRLFDEQIGCQEPEIAGVLGMNWDRNLDQLSLKPKFNMNGSFPLTKRKLLSLLISNFDPLGLVSPLFVRGKILLQDLWELGIGWDDVLSF